MASPYTLWKADDKEWLLEIHDEQLGDIVKEAEGLKVERFGIGINTPIRVFKVKTEDVCAVQNSIEEFLEELYGREDNSS
jgi:hypothetical protein